MEHRDVLKDEFDRFGRALGEIIKAFMGLKGTPIQESNINETNLKLKDDLDLNIIEILQFDINELEKYFSNHHFTSSHIELLSDYFVEVGEYFLNHNRQIAEKYLSQAILMNTIAEKISSTFSYLRVTKNERIRNLLSS